jgi:aspartate-semialdehyde dehydrogenase
MENGGGESQDFGRAKPSSERDVCPRAGHVGHSEAVHVEFERPLSVDDARAILSAAPGVTVIDERRDGGYATALDAAGTDPVYVSRLREDRTVAHGLNFWIVADNVRKGAALNAVQIAESLMSAGAF